MIWIFTILYRVSTYYIPNRHVNIEKHNMWKTIIKRFQLINTQHQKMFRLEFWTVKLILYKQTG